MTADDAAPTLDQTPPHDDATPDSGASLGAGPTATGPRPESVWVERGGIGEAVADSVEVRLGGIGRLEADDVFVQWGGVGAARADRVSVEFGSIGAALAGDVRVTQGLAGTIAARDAVLEQGIVRTLIARTVTINRPSAVLVLIAQKVEGDVRPVLDWRGAIDAGVAFGVASGVFRLLGRGRSRR